MRMCRRWIPGHAPLRLLSYTRALVTTRENSTENRYIRITKVIPLRQNDLSINQPTTASVQTLCPSIFQAPVVPTPLFQPVMPRSTTVPAALAPPTRRVNARGTEKRLWEAALLGMLIHGGMRGDGLYETWYLMWKRGGGCFVEVVSGVPIGIGSDLGKERDSRIVVDYARYWLHIVEDSLTRMIVSNCCRPKRLLVPVPCTRRTNGVSLAWYCQVLSRWVSILSLQSLPITFASTK